MDDQRRAPASVLTVTRRKAHVALFVALLLVAGVAFRTTLLQMWSTWDADPTFTYGFLIGPIVVWLLWQRRRTLREIPLASNPWGLGWLAITCVVWAVAAVLDVRVVAQFAAVAAVPGLVLTLFGMPTVRAMIFPLAYLFFMVPFGKDLVPLLMRITADLSVFLLNLSGIPVLREGMLLHIPAGTYEVARACSGIKYLSTAAVLGTLYAHLMYASWRKRLTAVATALTVAVLANGLRAYMLVLIGHLSDMRFDHDGWHVVLGQVLFALVMLGLFMVGHRFRDPESAFASDDSPPPPAVSRRDSSPSIGWIAVACAIMFLIAGRAAHPELTAIAEATPLPMLQLPAGQSGWTASPSAKVTWQPRYQNPLVVAEGRYEKGSAAVDVYQAAYRAPAGRRGELVTYGNQIDRDMVERQFPERDVEIVIANGKGTVREVQIDRGIHRRVMYWYVVNDQPTTSRYLVKWLELRALLRGRLAEERVVVVSVQGEQGEALEEFLVEHGASLGLTGRPVSAP